MNLSDIFTIDAIVKLKSPNYYKLEQLNNLHNCHCVKMFLLQYYNKTDYVVLINYMQQMTDYEKCDKVNDID